MWRIPILKSWSKKLVRHNLSATTFSSQLVCHNLSIIMEKKANQCCLCSAVTETFADMENHILTVHANIFRRTPAKPIALYPDVKKEGTKKTQGEKKETKNILQTTKENQRLDLTSEISFESNLMLGLVIVEGKKCPKCNFMATDETLLNSMKSAKKKSVNKQRGQVSKKKRKYVWINPDREACGKAFHYLQQCTVYQPYSNRVTSRRNLHILCRNKLEAFHGTRGTSEYRGTQVVKKLKAPFQCPCFRNHTCIFFIHFRNNIWSYK